MVTVEPLTDPIAHHGEGPVWDAAAGVVRWVDLTAGDLLALDLVTGTVDRRHVGTVAAALRPRRDGGLVVALGRRFALLDADPDTPPRLLDEEWTDPAIRFNDGGCDPQGRFWCGTMAHDATPGAGSLRCLHPDGTTTLIAEGVTISNGIAWSPDGLTGYYIDTPTQRVDAFDHDPDAPGLHDRRPLVEIPDAHGSPDGMCVDAEGGLWVALWDGGAVRRHRPDGSLDEVVTVPARRVTACTFAGPDLDRLVITTSREGLDPAADPLAGALFAATPGVRGLPTATFAG